MNDRDIQARYVKYVEQYKNLNCPDCQHKLSISVMETYNNTDDLISRIDLTCFQCHWSKRIDKLYSECVR